MNENTWGVDEFIAQEGLLLSQGGTFRKQAIDPLNSKDLPVSTDTGTIAHEATFTLPNDGSNTNITQRLKIQHTPSADSKE